jgi:hypothetical protein
MEAHHEINRRKTVVKRAIVMALSVILAIAVAAPIASGKQASMGKSMEPFLTTGGTGLSKTQHRLAR